MTRTTASWTRHPFDRPPPFPDRRRKRHTITLSVASSSLWCWSRCSLAAHTSRSVIDYCNECVTAFLDGDDKDRHTRMWWWERSSIHRWFNLRSKRLDYPTSAMFTLIITIIVVLVAIPNQLASKRRLWERASQSVVTISPKTII